MDITLWVDQPDGQGWDEEGNDDKHKFIDLAIGVSHGCHWMEDDYDRNQII